MGGDEDCSRRPLHLLADVRRLPPRITRGGGAGVDVSASLRLLIVDDDDTMLMMCRRFFEKLPGVEVTLAASGEEAIEQLRAHPFDAVLSDHRMGAVTGIDVLSYASEARPKTMRFMMSGYADPNLIMMAHSKARVHEFLEKPMTTQELNQLLQTKIVDPYFAHFLALAEHRAEP